MGFRKIALLIIATLAYGSAALAGSGGRGNGATHFLIVRTPLPIWQAPSSTGTVGLSASPSRIDSRVDSMVYSRVESRVESRVDSMVYSRVDSRR
jgi:hypothetical protein